MRGIRVARQLFRDRALTRMLAAYGLFCICEAGVWIAVIVYAYGRGGPTAAGLVAAAELVPAALCAPLFAAAADRVSPTRVLAGSYLMQAAGCALMASATGLGAPPVVVYSGAVVASTFVAAVRPAQTTVLPALTRDIAGLTAANVAIGWLESAGILLAGLMVGAGLATAGFSWVFVGMSVLLLIAAGSVIRVTARPMSAGEDLTAPWRDIAGAFRAVRRHRGAALLVGLLAGEFVVVGALDVLFVVLAVGTLHAGPSWTGYLNSAYGVGGVVAGGAIAVLLGRRLGPVIITAAVTVGAGLALSAVGHHVLPVACLLVAVGAGRAVYDIAARSLLQRVVAAQLVARVFGLAESVAMAGLAVGSLLTPAMIAAVGDRAAIVGVGLLLPALMLVSLRAVAALDDQAVIPVVEIALLRSVPLFRDLPAPALEGIAHALVREEAAPGVVLIREGAIGDDYVVLADGEVEVTQDGRSLRLLHRGDGAGEIALLHDVPRTATVTSITDVVLYRLSRGLFLAAVNAHVPTQRRAERIVGELVD